MWGYVDCGFERIWLWGEFFLWSSTWQFSVSPVSVSISLREPSSSWRMSCSPLPHTPATSPPSRSLLDRSTMHLHMVVKFLSCHSLLRNVKAMSKRCPKPLPFAKQGGRVLLGLHFSFCFSHLLTFLLQAFNFLTCWQPCCCSPESGLRRQVRTNQGWPPPPGSSWVEFIRWCYRVKPATNQGLPPPPGSTRAARGIGMEYELRETPWFPGNTLNTLKPPLQHPEKPWNTCLSVFGADKCFLQFLQVCWNTWKHLETPGNTLKELKMTCIDLNPDRPSSFCADGRLFIIYNNIILW